MEYGDGSEYDGQWMDDKHHGKGIMTGADGDKYDGEWKDGKRHGKGIETKAGGATYDGEWKDDKKCGKGIEALASGAIYDGERHGKYVEEEGQEAQPEATDNDSDQHLCDKEKDLLTALKTNQYERKGQWIKIPDEAVATIIRKMEAAPSAKRKKNRIASTSSKRRR